MSKVEIAKRTDNNYNLQRQHTKYIELTKVSAQNLGNAKATTVLHCTLRLASAHILCIQLKGYVELTTYEISHFTNLLPAYTFLLYKL